jgi:glycosyltransferase involved in cell wall biosynthesis
MPARLPGRARTDRLDKGLSLVVPVYNEERRLPRLLEVLRTSADEAIAAAGLSLAETVIVDDGSTDATSSMLAERAGAIPGIRVLRLPRNRGKGSAVRAGMLSVRSPFALVCDVDLSTPIDDVSALALAVEEEGVDIAIGSRDLPDSNIQLHQPAHREFMGRTFNRLLRGLTRLPYHDTQCGFKLFRVETTRPLFQAQRIDGFAYDVELLVLARSHGLRVAEVPVSWTHNEQTSVTLLGASTLMLFDLLRIVRRSRRDRRAGVEAHRLRQS